LQDFLTRPVDAVVVKGRSGVTKIFEVVDDVKGATDLRKAMVARSKKAIDLYFKRHFREVLGLGLGLELGC
jgi:hypothetical protein